MKGRKPKPTNLKILIGNPGRRPLNKREPKPRKGVTCPAWISDDAKKEWRRMAPSLVEMGLLTMADEAAFATYCQIYADLREAQRQINALESPTFTTDSGYTGMHPAFSMKKTAIQQFKAYLAMFGLTPSDRTRLEVRTEEDDDLDDLLFGPDRR